MAVLTVTRPWRPPDPSRRGRCRRTPPQACAEIRNDTKLYGDTGCTVLYGTTRDTELNIATRRRAHADTKRPRRLLELRIGARGRGRAAMRDTAPRCRQLKDVLRAVPHRALRGCRELRYGAVAPPYPPGGTTVTRSPTNRSTSVIGDFAKVADQQIHKRNRRLYKGRRPTDPQA